MILSLATGGLKYNFYVASLFQSDWSMCKFIKMILIMLIVFIDLF